MFKKILLPTDGSDLSAKAIQGGLEFAKALNASVVGVTVVEPYSYSNLSEYRPETLDDYEQRMMKSAAERLGSG
jgi:nucleotide-binding universal stress UspA family protein